MGDKRFGDEGESTASVERGSGCTVEVYMSEESEEESQCYGRSGGRATARVIAAKSYEVR